jgi:hypothetical protein
MKTNISIYPKAEGDWGRLCGASRHGNRFGGNFGWYKGGYKEFELILLDEMEEAWVKSQRVSLKGGEQIFRYETDMTRAGGLRPMVKVNVERGLVYFLTHGEDGLISFESKGNKLNFLNLVV